MRAFILENVSLIVFLVLAAGKGLVEIYAYRRQNRRGGQQSSMLSAAIIVLGSLTPVLILAEVLVLRHTLPLLLSLTFAGVYAILLVVRVVAVRTLGPYYSVNIRIVDDHRLVTEGIYGVLRHPIYLVGLLENLFYPLAAGAYLSAALLVLLGTPMLLVRRAEEEKLLLQKFGKEYERYKRSTWF
jgi:protein-S-isoprenylcysteine O-methyltransferase Ste14